jgi:hypothetical protein
MSRQLSAISNTNNPRRGHMGSCLNFFYKFAVFVVCEDFPMNSALGGLAPLARISDEAGSASTHRLAESRSGSTGHTNAFAGVFRVCLPVAKLP